MQHGRSPRLVAGALVLALPLLASCGFDKATDKVYTPGEGTNNRDGDVDVLAAVVVAAQPDSGTFIASLSNNSVTDDDAFSGLEGAGDWTDLTVADVSPAIDVPARGFVNLADEGGVNITGDFEAGDFMKLTLTFDSGETTTMNVPVVFACDDYTGLDTTSGGSASPDAEESESPSPGEVPTEGTTPSETESSSAPSGDTYDCASVLEEN